MEERYKAVKTGNIDIKAKTCKNDRKIQLIIEAKKQNEQICTKISEKC